MTRRRTAFGDWPLRYKLLAGYSGILGVLALLGGLGTYFLVRKTVEANIESELANTTTNILNMVQTAAQASIRNRLRAVATTNRNIADFFYSEFKAGRLTEAEARTSAEAALKSQTIGTTGYIYCLNSQGVLVMHPRQGLLGRDISEYRFVQEQMKRREGYLEYAWRNPGERAAKPKALYMVYFEPWDWIISASSYREEFTELISVEDFKASVLSLRFGETGYSYILDSRGHIVIHPYLSGDLYDAEDSSGYKFVHVICRQKSGKIVYTWQNPGETRFRKKLAFFNYIPEYDWIVVSTSYHDEFFAPLLSVRNIFIAITTFALLFMIPLSLRISHSVTKSIGRLKQGFEQGAAGNLSVRLFPNADDEIGQLMRYFNDFMARLEDEQIKRTRAEDERMQMAEQLRQSQKMEAIGQLAGGIAHDFNNILTAVRGSAELLRIQTRGQYPALIENIIQASTRAAGLTRNLLDFSRKGTLQTIPVDIHAVLKEVCDLLRHSIDKRILVSCRFESRNPVIVGDPSKLQNAFLNLGINARDAMPDGGQLDFVTSDVDLHSEHRTASGVLKPGRYVLVSVKDTGVGIPSHDLERIFEPFFTTKAEGKGTGLGLASVFGCVTIHNGEIDLCSRQGEGSQFDIYLPCPDYPTPTQDDIEVVGLMRGTGHILVIDDEDIVRQYAAGALVELGYTIADFGDADDAIAYFKAKHREVHLVLLDLMMPRKSGKETLEVLLSIDPEIPVIIVSGFSRRREGDMLREGARHFLRKPFALEDLSKWVLKYKRA